MEVILNTQEVNYDMVLLLASIPHKYAIRTTQIHITSKLKLCFRSRVNFRAILNFHLEV